MTISPENRKLFERLGVEGVRTDLLRGFEGNERIPRGPARHEGLEWLGEEERKQEQRETRRYWIMVVLTVITLILAAIAAWFSAVGPLH